MCFQARTDNPECVYLGESVEGFMEVFDGKPYSWNMWGKCWEDVLCVNINKIYQGDIPGF